MRRIIVISTFALAIALPVVAQAQTGSVAQDRQNLSQDRGNLLNDRVERRIDRDQKQIDRANLARDRALGDKAAIAQDKANLRQDRQVLSNDRAAIRQDHRDMRADHKDLRDGSEITGSKRVAVRTSLPYQTFIALSDSWAMFISPQAREAVRGFDTVAANWRPLRPAYGIISIATSGPEVGKK
jgi:hypothetical protein